MSRLRKVLDPTRTGKDAESLEKTLLKLIVGQDEAIEQIVNIYQMHIVVDPIFWTRKQAFLRWRAALKNKESQCLKLERITRPA